MKHEIIWFGDRPVAQVAPTGSRSYTLADHLGTPIIQTDATATVTWQAAYEPFGHIYAMRHGDRAAQPLRFPGQEVAMAWEGQEENYNVFRWYRGGWGRYTQADRIGLLGGINLFAYAADNPLIMVDPHGRRATPGHGAARTCCNRGQVFICFVQRLLEPGPTCVLEHEQEHVSFIRKWAPCNPCLGRRD
ncbi:MAG TPA: RHS repeat-associated core domain-containing protein, partial [Thermoanaerobaculia bacterium]|nr:RHS repeat-associated core domain-containing protein [Thermoanaerobaculia bacterium]